METNHNFLQAGGQPVSDRMRELLARAAQDHIYEQKSNGAALDEIRQRLEGMEWLLREVRERELTGLTSQLDAVNDRVDEIAGKPPEWANGLVEHIDSVGEKVKPIAELPSLWADVGVIAENVDESLTRAQSLIDANRQITDATAQTSAQLEAVGKRLDKLTGSMEAASVRFNRLDKTLAELGHRAEKLEHEVKAVSGRVEVSLSEMTERVDQGLEAVNGRVEGVGGRLDGLDGRMEGLNSRFDGVDGKFQGLDGKFQSLDGKLDGVAERFETVYEKIAHVPAALEIGELHRRLTELSERPVIDPTERFDALEQRFTDTVTPLIEELRVRPDRGEVEEAMEKIVISAHDEVVKRMQDVHDEVRRQATVMTEGLAGQVTKLKDDVSRQVTHVHEDVAKHVTNVHENVTKQVTNVHEDMTKQVNGVHEDVTKKVGGISDDVARQVTTVRDDMTKRLGTLEETMLALAEALLRPRRESKE